MKWLVGNMDAVTALWSLTEAQVAVVTTTEAGGDLQVVAVTVPFRSWIDKTDWTVIISILLLHV